MEQIIGVFSLLVLYAGISLLIGKPESESGWEDKED